MKNIISLLTFSFVIVAAMFLLSACVDDDKNDSPLSGVPLTFIYSNGDVNTFSYTNGNKLSKITYGKLGESLSLIYNGSNLVRCDLTHKPGTGGVEHIEFTYAQNNTILAKLVTTDKTVFAVDTILVGSAGSPNSISRKGVGGGYSVVYRFILDESLKKISEKLLFYEYEDGRIILKLRTIYSYDNKPGTASLLDCPKWFSTYLCTAILSHVSDKQLLNCVNNLVRETMYQDPNPEPVVLNHTYTYNSVNFPASVNEGQTQEEITIKYQQ